MNGPHYFAAIDDLLAYCRAHAADQIVSIYLGGSVARGDFTPDRSDIDIYIVLRERNPAVERAIAEAARQIEAQRFSVLLRYNPEPLSVTFTSLEEIDNERSFLGAGFEHQGFVTTAKRLWGEDIVPRIPATPDERSLDIAQFALNMLQALVQAQDSMQVTPELAGFLFSPIFRAAAIGLGGQGQFVGSKHATVAAFAASYPEQAALNTALGRSYALWQQWATRDLSDEETRELAQLCKDFVAGAYALWCA